MIRALEFFAGIGGFAFAARSKIEISLAFEISPHCVDVYRNNFDHPVKQVDLNSELVDIPDAEMWWVSAPCTPFTRRGPKRDLDDHRAEPFVTMMNRLTEKQPAIVAIENVEGFVESQGHSLWRKTTEEYQVWEAVVCPTAIGIPNKRPRYYSVAVKPPFVIPEFEFVDEPLFTMAQLLDISPGEKVSEKVLGKYRNVMHFVTENDQYTTCFTGGYGKSWVYAGSFIDAADGPRLFSPEQIAFAHGMEVRWPDDASNRQRYKYLGNSLSIPVVRQIVGAICDANPS